MFRNHLIDRKSLGPRLRSLVTFFSSDADVVTLGRMFAD